MGGDSAGGTRMGFGETEFGGRSGRAGFGQTEEDMMPSQASGNTFLQYKNNVAIHEGHSFRIGAHHRLVQVDALRQAGIQRMRVAFSNPTAQLWEPDHEVFVGLSYGEGRYFGFIVSATTFSGIFSLRALASAAPAPNEPMHLTGSG